MSNLLGHSQRVQSSIQTFEECFFSPIIDYSKKTRRKNRTGNFQITLKASEKLFRWEISHNLALKALRSCLGALSSLPFPLKLLADAKIRSWRTSGTEIDDEI